VSPGQVSPDAIVKPGPYVEEQIHAKIYAGLRFIDSIGLPPVGTDDEIVGPGRRDHRQRHKNWGKIRSS